MADVIVLYGTQTGTAKGAAQDIGREATRRKLRVKVMGFDDYDIRELPA